MTIKEIPPGQSYCVACNIRYDTKFHYACPGCGKKSPLAVEPCECCGAFIPEGATRCPACVLFRAKPSSDKSTLLSYLQLCIRDEDWHGVWDTAIMLEVLAAKEKCAQ
jgi:predicted amidophosphoribosyltransferase